MPSYISSILFIKVTYHKLRKGGPTLWQGGGWGGGVDSKFKYCWCVGRYKFWEYFLIQRDKKLFSVKQSFRKI